MGMPTYLNRRHPADICARRQ